MSAVDIGNEQVLLTSSTHCHNVIIFPFVTLMLCSFEPNNNNNDNSMHYYNYNHCVQ